MTQNRYDAHCHIFTLQYAIKEAKQILFDVLKGNYPLHKDEKALGGLPDGLIISRFSDLLKQLHELFDAAKGSEKENLEFLLAEGTKAYPQDTMKIIPLMMDIYYMFAYSLDKDQKNPPIKAAQSAMQSNKEFETVWNSVLDTHKKNSTPWNNFLNYVFKHKTWLANKLAVELVELERKIESIVNNNKNTSYIFHPTAGYCFHLENIRALEAQQKGKLFPFVAIDPRRPGIIEELQSGSFFTGDGRFYGVKLYPMLGYHPQCEPLSHVYDYCSKNNLPITFHCSNAGFPPIAYANNIEFGNPENFTEIITKYPNLKINFAHFGNDFFGTSYTWTDTIVQLINKHDNVFTDLSCYTDSTKLKHIKALIDQNQKLQKRIMFGSDFDVVYFTSIGVTMQNYHQMFKQIFPQYIDAMMCENVERFMNF